MYQSGKCFESKDALQRCSKHAVKFNFAHFFLLYWPQQKIALTATTKPYLMLRCFFFISDLLLAFSLTRGLSRFCFALI